MGTGDIEDPRELEALREKARVRLTDFNGNRTENLVYSGGLGKGRWDQVQGYLNHYDLDFLQTIQDKKYLGILQELTLQTAVSREMAPNETDHMQYQRAYESLAGPALADEPSYHKLKPDSVFLQDEISRLRAVALLNRQFRGEEPTERMQVALKRALVRQYVEKGLEAPASVRAFVSPAELEGAYARWRALQNYGGEQRKAVLRDQLMTDFGLHRKMAERIAMVRLTQQEAEQTGDKPAEYQELIKAKLDDFIQDYPRPEVLLDKILDLKDGKLPI